MTDSIFATVLPIQKEVFESLGIASDVQVRHASGLPDGASGAKPFGDPVTITAYVEEIGGEQWSWSPRAWTENPPKRMTKITFLEPIRISQGDQVLVPDEPWRQIKDWRYTGKAVTSCVIA